MPLLAVSDAYFKSVFSRYHLNTLVFDKAAAKLSSVQHLTFLPLLMVAKFGERLLKHMSDPGLPVNPCIGWPNVTASVRYYLLQNGACPPFLVLSSALCWLLLLSAWLACPCFQHLAAAPPLHACCFILLLAG